MKVVKGIIKVFFFPGKKLKDIRDKKNVRQLT